jgi:L-fuculose-phosphate aldolase
VSHLELRQELCDAYKTLYSKGWIMSCDGNVSVRAPDGNHILMTPTGINTPDLTAATMVLCDSNGDSLEKLKPTSEKDLHTLIYQSRPDVGAIVHSHSIYACALACCRIPLPPAHYAVCELLHNTAGVNNDSPENVMVKCTPYYTYGTWELAMASLAGLGQNHAVLLANHGAVVVGPDLATAMHSTERLERECEIYWRAMQFSSSSNNNNGTGANNGASAVQPQALTYAEIQALHKRDLTYGQEADAVVSGPGVIEKSDVPQIVER